MRGEADLTLPTHRRMTNELEIEMNKTVECAKFQLISTGDSFQLIVDGGRNLYSHKLWASREGR